MSRCSAEFRWSGVCYYRNTSAHSCEHGAAPNCATWCGTTGGDDSRIWSTHLLAKPGALIGQQLLPALVCKPGTCQQCVDVHHKHSVSPCRDAKQWLEARNAAPRAQQHRALTAAAPRYPAPHPLWQPISSPEFYAEDSSSSGYGTAPEPSLPIDEALGARIKPDHEWRMGRLRWIRAVGGDTDWSCDAFSECAVALRTPMLVVLPAASQVCR